MSDLREKVARAIANPDTPTTPVADRAIAAVFDWLPSVMSEMVGAAIDVEDAAAWEDSLAAMQDIINAALAAARKEAEK